MRSPARAAGFGDLTGPCDHGGFLRGVTVQTANQQISQASEDATHRLDLYRAYLEYMRNMSTVVAFAGAAVLEFKTKILFETDLKSGIATALLFLISFTGALFAGGVFLENMKLLLRRGVAYAAIWFVVGILTIGFCAYMIYWIVFHAIAHPASG